MIDEKHLEMRKKVCRDGIQPEKESDLFFIENNRKHLIG